MKNRDIHMRLLLAFLGQCLLKYPQLLLYMEKKKISWIFIAMPHFDTQFRLPETAPVRSCAGTPRPRRFLGNSRDPGVWFSLC